MADKIFIGKVTEKTFSNGGSIIKLSLSEKDKALLAGPGYATIDIKRSKTKGTYYAELSEFQPKEMPEPKNYGNQVEYVDPTNDLPF
jgi:hypothetical protein